jgi:hypothetical protein
MTNDPRYKNNGNGNTRVPITGHEEFVEEYALEKRAFELQKKRLAVKEARLRDLAVQAAKSTGYNTRSFAFTTSDGVEAVKLSVFDLAAPTSRLTLKDAHINDAVELFGTSIDQRIEEEKKIVLTGQWIDWFEQAMLQLKQAGHEMSDDADNGVSRQVTKRFSREAALELLKMADLDTEHGRAAFELFRLLTKDPAIKV